MTAPRVRFAPSPTGYLHVGGARTALFNWLFARREGGVFVLRIEDTDSTRSTEEMTRAILEGMQWLGLDWDEGPFHQVDGFPRHREEAFRLLAEGRAYRCFLTAEELQARRAEAETAGASYRYHRSWSACSAEESEQRAADGEPFTIRFRVPDGVTEWHDGVHGPTRFRNEDVEDFIILRSDGTPVYNLACVSDDLEMRITHVMRGDDHISNTARQILLYQALGAPIPVFAHLPMILGPDGRRLSKRHGATAVGEYQEQGILPQTLLNFLALLGWSPGDDREIMTRDELINAFGIERINKKSAVFDPEKLDWMNGKYLETMPAEELLELVAPLFVEAGLATAEELVDRRSWYVALLEQLKVRSRRVGQVVEQARTYLEPLTGYDPQAVAKVWKDPAEAAARLQVVQEALEQVEPWEPAALDAALRAAAERAGIGLGKLAQPLRLALTGGTASPGIDQVVFLLGPNEVSRRIEAAREVLIAKEAEQEAR